MKLIVNSKHAVGIYSRRKSDVFLLLFFSKLSLMEFNLFFQKIGSDVEISESDSVLLSGLVDTCWI